MSNDALSTVVEMADGVAASSEHFFQQSVRLLMIPVKLLVFEDPAVTSAVCSLLEREFFFRITVTPVTEPLVTAATAAIVDDVFQQMDAQSLDTESITIFLVPTRLFTVFDHEIVAETRGKRIVVSTPKLTQTVLPRVLRHEIGLAVGLEVHWGCVMSRYFIENPVFCVQCRAKLLERGISWRPNPALT